MTSIYLKNTEDKSSVYSTRAKSVSIVSKYHFLSFDKGIIL